MSDMQVRGPLWGGPGAPSPLTGGVSGSQRTSDAHGRYLQAVLENRAFYLSAAAAAPTAYVGAAGGTPLLAIHNPTGSNKLFALLMVGFANRATATAAGTTGLNVWSGPSVQPTGTLTPPTSALSAAASGSSARGHVNAALTGSTALALALPLHVHYWATAAGAISSPSMFDIGGLVVAAPGNQIAVGLTVIPTTLTADVAMYWEELPYLPQG